MHFNGARFSRSVKRFCREIANGFLTLQRHRLD
jgi:hypothetical protein